MQLLQLQYGPSQVSLCKWKTFSYKEFEISVVSGDPTVTLAEGMGTLRGKEKQTVGNLGAEPKTYYRFSNIKYAHMVSEENRFKVRQTQMSKNC